MPAPKIEGSTSSTRAMDSDFSAQTWNCGDVGFIAHWGQSGGVVCVHGEIDAANSKQFADQLADCAASCDWLIVDLSKLQFIGTAGFAALEAIGARCASARVYWSLVPGPVASRLLQVCDPDSRLPVIDSVTAGLATVRDTRLLKLIS